MQLTAGSKLGPYEILGTLGAGGMGEVYRARDTKLGRDVAVKILPENVAADPERMGRFEREAHLLAALNHTNIAAIYGLEDSGPRRALVIELVEGPTLAERIGRGRLPVEEALSIARQIAEGLEYAHEHGIVHRDLKPANVKLRPDGVVKILDFGLARALRGDTTAADVSHSPTITEAATKAGVILGTAAYMSPEQARGKPVDKRADAWAFGCVLYEMLSGRRAFEGETISDTLAAVLRAEPDWSALPTEAPTRLRDLLRRCLAKDPKQRLRDLGDARLEIEGLIAVGASDAGAAPRAGLATSRTTWRALLAAGVVGAALAGLLAIGLVLSGIWPRRAPKDTRPLRVSIVHTEGSEVGAPAISPDGRRIAYRARRADGMPLIWVRDLDSSQARPLSGTEDGILPFWSTDSRDLAFFAGDALKSISADGGPVRVIAGAPAPGGGAWAADGTILFNPQGLELYRVSAAGGVVKAASSLPGKDWNHLWPSFLPDGRQFLFTARLWTSTAEASEQGIYLGSLDSPEVRRILPDLSSAVYAPPGHIVFARDGILTAAPLDLDTGRLKGAPRPLGEAVAVDGQWSFAGLSTAADGTLAVRPSPACELPDGYPGTCDTSLRLVDREGRVVSTSSPQPYRTWMALSPDARRAATTILDRRNATNDVWLVDLASDTRLPLTLSHGFAAFPFWSSDGARIVYAYQPPGQLDDIHVKDLRTGQVTPVIESPTVLEHPMAWSHDGAHLLLTRWNPGDDYPAVFHWSFASRTLRPFVTTSLNQQFAVFSPDDRYVAFSSMESGRFEVYVTTFPERRRTWRLTTDGGQVLSWRKDGREILVATLSGHIAAYPVSTEGGFTTGQPTILVRDVGASAVYTCPTPDHSRLFIRVSPDAAKDKGEIRLLFNWAEVLKGD